MPGYSGNPLWKKLGLKPGMVALVEGAPKDYPTLLDLPADIKVTWTTKLTAQTALVHVFATKLAPLAARLKALRPAIVPDAAIWVSWPKKAAKVPTDITEDRIREIALPLGFVDIKVCAVSEVWSGLKLVIRRSER